MSAFDEIAEEAGKPVYGPPTPTELAIFEGMGNSRDGWRVPEWGLFDAFKKLSAEEDA